MSEQTQPSGDLKHVINALTEAQERDWTRKTIGILTGTIVFILCLISNQILIVSRQLETIIKITAPTRGATSE